MNISQKTYDILADGTKITQIDLINSSQFSVSFINLGATLVCLNMPDKKGNQDNIVLSHYHPENYLKEDSPYFGATIGRFANRIAGGHFRIDGQFYQLSCNEGNNHLHGGNQGFDKKIWDYEIACNGDVGKIIFRYTSPIKEEGYPGSMDVKLEVSLDEHNCLCFNYFAQSSHLCPINLTNHTYWNLSGAGNESILDHQLQIDASSLLEVDSQLIPSGRFLPVEGTAFDFRKAKTIRDLYWKTNGGYDHCYVIKSEAPFHKRRIAVLYHPQSGRKMTLYSDQPSLQLYTATGLLPQLLSRKRVASYLGGICLEPQNFPDAPNHAHFPNCLLKPGESYQQTSCYQFEIQ